MPTPLLLTALTLVAAPAPSLLDVLAGSAVVAAELNVDRAADSLSVAGGQDESRFEARTASSHESMGIGHLADIPLPHREAPALTGRPRRAARSKFNSLTGAVSKCYGQGLIDANVTRDAITAAVRINKRGRVTDARILKASKLGDINAEHCVVTMLRRQRFPAGLTQHEAEAQHTWRFRLGNHGAVFHLKPAG